jgi:peptidoglycan/LPS O-acetylase OafA/YrhL
MLHPTPDVKPRIFFPNLDGLRFISFMLVFGFHIHKTIHDKYLLNGIEMPAVFKVLQVIFKNGQLGVNLFFVLSGFLITFLLIKEKELKGRISVGKFYMRRILRIWPLFYLCIFTGFILFPLISASLGLKDTENANPVYYLFFINNFDVINSGFPNALILGILWSVAVEEQFYLCWPLLLFLVPARYLKHLCIGIIAASILFRFFHRDNQSVLYFHTFAVIGDMALGGLLACFTSYESKFKNAIVNLPRKYIFVLYLAAIVLVVFKQRIFISTGLIVFERLLFALFFGFIILEQNFANNSFFKFSRVKLMSKLGVYTYGLYCLHFIGIYLALLLVNQFSFKMSAGSIFLLQPLLALAITMVLSILSYHYFEKRFLTYKGRFAIIVKD